MKKLSMGIFTFLLTLSLLSAKGQNQAQMNAQAQSELKKANTELNKVYQQILKEYSSKSRFINNLKASERLWVQFRDAELATRYPEAGQYGTVEPSCRANYLTGLTRERIKSLRVWLDGIEEGDVCTGSVKIKR